MIPSRRFFAFSSTFILPLEISQSDTGHAFPYGMEQISRVTMS
ncbi:hypothetical protein LHGZ1_2998 [Laribacter hongkongensis]|uniref:Uncharacterized protein n=1 Tax=Laribacter hongkongensis TaxID=168471 RepID=A0A248LMV4_9NEIS|nr:hypothetical protein LHGZ1_2998 [Laribacter hongkongensis]